MFRFRFFAADMFAARFASKVLFPQAGGPTMSVNPSVAISNKSGTEIGTSACASEGGGAGFHQERNVDHIGKRHDAPLPTQHLALNDFTGFSTVVATAYDASWIECDVDETFYEEASEEANKARER